VEDAASVEGNKLAMMIYPVQITHKNLITLPFLDPDAQVRHWWLIGASVISCNGYLYYKIFILLLLPIM